jgi:hypothetical protein
MRNWEQKIVWTWWAYPFIFSTELVTVLDRACPSVGRDCLRVIRARLYRRFSMQWLEWHAARISAKQFAGLLWEWARHRKIETREIRKRKGIQDKKVVLYYGIECVGWEVQIVAVQRAKRLCRYCWVRASDVTVVWSTSLIYLLLTCQRHHPAVVASG